MRKNRKREHVSHLPVLCIRLRPHYALISEKKQRQNITEPMHVYFTKHAIYPDVGSLTAEIQTLERVHPTYALQSIIVKYQFFMLVRACCLNTVCALITVLLSRQTV